MIPPLRSVRSPDATDRGPEVSSEVLPQDPIRDVGRLDAVRATRLLDTGAEEAFDHLTRVAARALSVPFAFVTVVDETRSFWKSCYGVDSDALEDRQNTVEQSFCQYVVRSNGPLVVSDAVSHPVTRTNPSIDSMGVRSWAGWPIRSADGHVLGTFCAVSLVERDWSDDDTQLLALMADAAAREIRLRIVAEDAIDEAARLRTSLLPPELPAVPGLDIAATHLSASGPGTVLGDFYDVFPSHRGRWHALLGDVCGSGVEAAGVASLARWSYHALAETHDRPEEIFTALNRLLLRHAGGRFLTAQALSIDPAGAPGRRTVRFASAGHHPALVVRAGGGVEDIEANGWMLGAFDSLVTGAADVVLEVGDRLVMFTDGVTEADCGPSHLGHDRVRTLLADMPPPTASAQITAAIVDLVGQLSGGEPPDDTAVLVIGVADA